jgi:hypothetical protein
MLHDRRHCSCCLNIEERAYRREAEGITHSFGTTYNIRQATAQVFRKLAYRFEIVFCVERPGGISPGMLRRDANRSRSGSKILAVPHCLM